MSNHCKVQRQHMNIKLFQLEQNLHHCTTSERAKGLIYAWLFVLLCHCFMQPPLLFANSTPVSREGHAHGHSSGIAADQLLQREHHGLPQEKAAADGTGVRLVTQEVRYRLPEADEVFLVWGINLWSVVPTAIRPAGTVLHNGIMRTPMVYEDGHFVAKLQVPSSATISYGFFITKARHGTPMKPLWDGDRAYHTMALKNGVIDVKPKLQLSVTQEIRYYMPEADKVILVWGINGWSVVPAAVRPIGTVLHNGVMLTPMAPVGKRFVGKVQVPPGTALNYGFLITPKHHDTSTNPIWDGKPDYHKVVTQENVIEVPAAQTPAKTPRLWLQLLLGISIAVGIGATLKRIL